MSTQTTFLVPGMTCGHCTQAVTDEVSKIAGVTSVNVDLDSKSVAVESTSPVAWDALVAAVDEAGFEAVAG
jgi:copper ion binding protein